MNTKLIEALGTLDVSNDNHWTSEGLPKLEALRFAYGSTVTREEVETASPGYTRTNRVFQVDASKFEVKQGDEVTFTPGQVGDVPPAEPQAPVGDLTYTVTVESMVNALLSPLELTPIEELSDEQLQELADNHSAILTADRELHEAIEKRAFERARYLSKVAEELAKRFPAPSQAEAGAAFRSRMMEIDGSKLAINRPRQMQRGTIPLKG